MATKTTPYEAEDIHLIHSLSKLFQPFPFYTLTGPMDNKQPLFEGVTGSDWRLLCDYVGQDMFNHLVVTDMDMTVDHAISILPS